MSLDTSTGGAITLSDYLGKTVRFKLDINPTDNFRLAIYQLVNGSWSNVNSEYSNEQGTLSVDTEISSNATRVQFRLHSGSSTVSGKTVDINNWEVYQI